MRKCCKNYNIWAELSECWEIFAWFLRDLGELASRGDGAVDGFFDDFEVGVSGFAEIIEFGVF